MEARWSMLLVHLRWTRPLLLLLLLRRQCNKLEIEKEKVIGEKWEGGMRIGDLKPTFK
jgi:hypothetical protein